MSRPRNTRDEIIPIPAVHGVHIPGAIEAQEAEGAAAMQRDDCETIPVEGASDDALIALGFVLGPVDAKDELFRKAILPAGWSRAGTGHSMHTDIVDELGRKRVSIFYKAAWYDRRADLSITTVYGYVSHCMYEDTPPVLDETWATREAVVETLGQIKTRELKSVELWSDRSDDYARERVTEARASIAKCEALAAELAGGGA